MSFSAICPAPPALIACSLDVTFLTCKINLQDLCSQQFYQIPISLLQPPLTRGQFAQELLSTFSTSIGEVALIPSTGGIFTIDIVHSGSPSNSDAIKQEGQVTTQTSRLWDREAQGGFPEVKHLKQLVRNIIDPTRDLGHVDGHRKDKKAETASNDKPAGTQKSSSSGTSRGERTVPLDPDAAVARGPPDDEQGMKTAKEKGEVCEDCA